MARLMAILMLLGCLSASAQKLPRQNGAGGAIVFHSMWSMKTRKTPGPLTGLTFAVKDSFDIKGYKTGFGQPVWYATTKPATATNPAVAALLAAGGEFVGKTIMDEMAYSLNGQNAHFGTPVNPICPDRIPGGSSSGSAVAVSGGLVDFALAEDTGGSIRVPASYNGLYAMRPTQGRVSLKNSQPLAKTFDTAGTMTRSMDLLRRTMTAMLSTGPSSLKKSATIRRFMLVDDAFAIMDADARVGMTELLQRHMTHIRTVLGTQGNVTVGTKFGGLGAWPGGTFTPIQGFEAWKAHGAWISKFNPELGPGVKERFALASTFTSTNYTEALARKAAIKADLDALLRRDTVLIVPAAPGPAILLNATAAEGNAFRGRALSLTAIAGLGGLPQVVMPAIRVAGCPVGLGLIGPEGSDEVLLRLATEINKIINA